MDKEHDVPYPEVSTAGKRQTNTGVVIVGAGFAGICMAIDLIRKNQCREFVILEKAGGLGGVWRDNVYPGCASDVLSILYSYSFEQSPDWSGLHPGQKELLNYLYKVAAKWDLFKHMRFNSEVASAKWDDDAARWNVDVKIAPGSYDSEFVTGYTISCDFLVSAVGQLNIPKYPDNTPGLFDVFNGKVMHSARWDWTYDVKGKKVAVIGAGSSAVQLLPGVADAAASVTVYQRSPAWVIPRQDARVSPLQKTLYRYVPGLQSRVRATLMDRQESVHAVPRAGLNDGKAATADTATPFETAASDRAMLGFVAGLASSNLQGGLSGREDLIKRLTPNYEFGCKRFCVSDDYYPTFKRAHVALETRKMKRFSRKGIVVQSSSAGNTASQGEEGATGDEEEEREFDLIICATGFQATKFLYPIEITGRRGQKLSEIWSETGPISYLGVTAPELPNFAALWFVNTNLGHSSSLLMIEAGALHATAMAKAVLEHRSSRRLTLVAKKARIEAYNEVLQTRLRQMVWSSAQCGSWFKEGATGRVTNNWPGTVVEYQKMLEKINWDDWEDGERVVAMRKARGEPLSAAVPSFPGDAVPSASRSPASGASVEWVGRVREETYVSQATLGRLVQVGGMALATVAAVGLAGRLVWGREFPSALVR